MQFLGFFWRISLLYRLACSSSALVLGGDEWFYFDVVLPGTLVLRWAYAGDGHWSLLWKGLVRSYYWDRNVFRSRAGLDHGVSAAG